MKRGIAILFSSLLLVGCTGMPNGGGSTPSTSPAAAVAADPEASQEPGGCGSTRMRMGSLPAWTASAGAPDLPSVMSHEGNLVGVVFGHPLVAPASASGRQNKILWIVREPRNGSELELTLRPEAGGDAVNSSEPSGSSPGEIYPSIVDVPAAGCWDVVAEWNGHRATLELFYQPGGK
jgi:hypothetical protein